VPGQKNVHPPDARPSPPDAEVISRQLNVTITGEGIETTAQEAALRALGCDVGQGYLFARPLTAAALEAMLGELGPATELSLAA